ALAKDEAGRIISVTGSAADAGMTRLLVQRDGEPLGTLDLADRPRADAADLLASLESAGISTLIATGDSRGPALTIGTELGLDPELIHYGLTAQEKAGLIARSARPVMFVGDGVND